MTDPELRRSPFRRLLWFLGLLALAMSVISVALVHHYGETRPRESNAAVGRTHGVKIHGQMVYLTSSEIGAAFFTHAIAIVALGAFLGVLLKARSAGASPPPADSTLRP
jgi:hypothetical protein